MSSLATGLAYLGVGYEDGVRYTSSAVSKARPKVVVWMGRDLGWRG